MPSGYQQTKLSGRRRESRTDFSGRHDLLRKIFSSFQIIGPKIPRFATAFVDCVEHSYFSALATLASGHFRPNRRILPAN